MPESEEHSNLVSILQDYIAAKFLGGDNRRVLTDTKGLKARPQPPSIEGYVPDVYAIRSDRPAVVIGEAKTPGDLENSHTEAQLTAFLKRCAQQERSVFILAVHWPVERLAKSFLSQLQAREGLSHVDVVVLSEIGMLKVHQNG